MPAPRDTKLVTKRFGDETAKNLDAYVKQGGYASDTVGAADKLSYDLYYLKHRSMLLNFAIVAKTAATVVSGSGAR